VTPPTIIVLFGGPSDERQVSVASAQAIIRALDAPLMWFWAPEGAIHDVRRDDVLAHERPFEVDFQPFRPAIFPDVEMALDAMPVENPVFLLALHGTGGEDGTLQAMLEKRGIPFTGSGSEASERAFDKAKAKAALAGRVRMAESRIANAHDLKAVAQDMLTRHERLVLKPLAGGSSRGLYFVGKGDPLPGIAIPYIVEQFISGRELTCGVIDDGSGPRALDVIEIEVDPGREFDYAGKYLGSGTREICPANIPPELARKAQDVALAAHIGLGCEGYSRTDMLAHGDDIFYLETNTLPGLTVSSLVPQELRTAGIGFREFLEKQIELGVARCRQPA
jgi:D-alanine-D-alanine ligase